MPSMAMSHHSGIGRQYIENYEYDKYFSMNDFELDEKEAGLLVMNHFQTSVDISLKNEKFLAF